MVVAPRIKDLVVHLDPIPNSRYESYNDIDTATFPPWLEYGMVNGLTEGRRNMGGKMFLFLKEKIEKQHIHSSISWRLGGGGAKAVVLREVKGLFDLAAYWIRYHIFLKLIQDK